MDGWVKGGFLTVLRSLLRLILIAALIAPGACVSQRKHTPNTTTVLASLVGQPPTAVEVQVENLPPSQHIERVFLVDRQGHRLAASEVEWNTEPSAAQRPQRLPLTFGVGFASSLIIGLPRNTQPAAAAVPGSLTAHIPLFDGEAYLDDPAAWTVVVEGWKRNGAPLSYRVPAPRPPKSRQDAPPLPARKP